MDKNCNFCSKTSDDFNCDTIRHGESYENGQTNYFQLSINSKGIAHLNYYMKDWSGYDDDFFTIHYCPLCGRKMD
jgi:hypothetical protein